jgi:hypothetical protein
MGSNQLGGSARRAYARVRNTRSTACAIPPADTATTIHIAPAPANDARSASIRHKPEANVHANDADQGPCRRRQTSHAASSSVIAITASTKTSALIAADARQPAPNGALSCTIVQFRNDAKLTHSR